MVIPPPSIIYGHTYAGSAALGDVEYEIIEPNFFVSFRDKLYRGISWREEERIYFHDLRYIITNHEYIFHIND